MALVVIPFIYARPLLHLTTDIEPPVLAAPWFALASPSWQFTYRTEPNKTATSLPCEKHLQKRKQVGVCVAQGSGVVVRFGGDWACLAAMVV